jgi:peptide/nickel transport system ATP-binding protein
MKAEVLEVTNLSVSFRNGNEVTTAVDNISFSLKKGCTTGIVGESGSGKSVTALSVMHLLASPPATIVAEKMILYSHDGVPTDLNSLTRSQWQQIRGNRISMIFQEPMTSLNPVMRCGKQVVEAVRAHQAVSNAEAKKKTLSLFREVLLPDPEGAYNAYPHELSGGQKQRVMIAMAVASHPDILIADEPTTALDVTVQQSVIQLLKDLQKTYGMAILFITHDLALIRFIANDLLVMKDGKIVENGPVESVYHHPQHPYTRELIASSLKRETSSRKENTTDIYNRKPLLELKNLTTSFAGKRKRKDVTAVNNVDLRVYPGEVLGLVGESGCGKTTLGRTILRLVEPDGGHIRFGELDLLALRDGSKKKMRKDIQIIFQDPYSSLNPMLTAGSALTEPMAVHGIGRNYRERKAKAIGLLEKVGLGEMHFNRYPHELSGGQRQRICIARALSVEPKFIVCDESVSALDITVQAQVLALLKKLKDELGLTYIFISHDLSVVRYISDRIAVMKDGKIVELGPAEEIYNAPKSEYTKNLIASIPT